MTSKLKPITMVAALLGSTALVHAQEPAGESSADEGVSSEIIVTALKRANSVQDVAASVDVVGAEAIINSGVATVEDLKTIVPSLIIQRPPNNTVSVSVRGLGSAAGPVSFDQSVSLFVDGVYAPRGAEFLSAMFDIEKVEVVKGTQAAVLGKNTSLGGVLLTTRKPGFKLAANAMAQYEFERNSTILSGGADIPVGNDFAVRAAVQMQDLGGYMPNRFDGRKSRKNQTFSGRFTARWQPTSDIDATLSYQYENMKSVGVNAEPVKEVGNFFLTLFTLAGRPDLYEVTPDRSFASSKTGGPSTTTQPSHRITGTLNWQLGEYDFTAITGWSKFSQSRYVDRDYVVGDYFSEQVDVKGRQFSQELRLSSPAEDRLNFIIGGLFVDNSLDQELVNRVAYPVGASSLPFPLFGAYRQDFSQDTTTWSGFGQLNFKVLDNLVLSGGLRYTSEKKKGFAARTQVSPGFYGAPLSAPGPHVDPEFPLTPLSRKENVVDGSVGLEFRPVERVLLYASWGQGTKGGGFSDTTLASEAEYKKEVARTYEAGVKLEGLSRKWRFNLAGFSTKVKDYQNNQFNGQRFVIQNLDLKSQGVEVQAYVAPFSGFSMSANGTYAKARNLSQVPGIGDEVPRAPRLSGQVEATYEMLVNDRLSLTLAGDVTHRSSMTHQTNPNAVPRGDAFTTLNGRISLADDQSGLQLSLIGRNLTNAYSLAFAFPASFAPPGNAVGIPEDSRTIALQLTFKY